MRVCCACVPKLPTVLVVYWRVKCITSVSKNILFPTVVDLRKQVQRACAAMSTVPESLVGSADPPLSPPTVPPVPFRLMSLVGRLPRSPIFETCHRFFRTNPCTGHSIRARGEKAVW